MRFCVFLLAVFVGIGLAGCRKHSVLPLDTPPKTEQSERTTIPEAIPKTNPVQILDRMVDAYQNAFFYRDEATVQIIGKMLQPNTEPPPRNCGIVFQKPNQIRLSISDGLFVSDGKNCYGQIHSLPDQILNCSAPEHLTLETFFQDVYLDHAMSLGLPVSVLRFPPQLVLLFAQDPLNTFCPKGAQVDWLEQRQIGRNLCDVVRVSHSDGNRILWISQSNSALLRLDYQPVGLPVPEGFASIETIRIEMTDAQFNGVVSESVFQPSPFSSSVIQVSELKTNAPEIPTPQEHRRRLNLMMESDTYRLADQQIESVVTPEHASPKSTPKTFTLSSMWKQPLVGGSTFALLPSAEPKLLVPCEGNMVTILNVQGEVLQKIAPQGLENSIITNIQVSPKTIEKQRVGILTLDGKFSLFDESFTPLSASPPIFQGDDTEKIRDFHFIPHKGNALILLAIQKQSSPENVVPNGILCMVDEQGIKHWEHPFEGIPNHVLTAKVDGQDVVLVSVSTTEQDFILAHSAEGIKLDSTAIPFGRRVLWFQLVDSTIYTLLEDPNTGDVRFAGLTKHGKGLWSRLLPTGEYETEPVFVSNKQKWFVPLPNGEIIVLDLQGNVLDTFSLNVVPTGLFCAEIEGNTLLLIADGAIVSVLKWE